MKIKYRGPGDSVELDGLTIKKGATTEVTTEQYLRLTADREATVDVVESKEGGR